MNEPPDQTLYVLNVLRTSILTEAEDADFVRDDYAKGLRFAAKLIDDEIHNETEWRRIMALAPDQVRAELLAEGYTEERLNAGLARIKETLARATKDQA